MLIFLSQVSFLFPWFFKNIFWCGPFIYSFVAVLRLWCCAGFSLVATSEGSSWLWCAGFSLRWLLLLQSMGFRARGLQELWCMGLVALRHVGSSQIRDQTPVSCIGRQILYHWATREASFSLIIYVVFSFFIPSLWRFVWHGLLTI